ncbi:hypothetical protein VOLCADRAFT_31465, partial [Volvox carteri f. nagariensis]
KRKVLGGGTYATVYVARCKRTGQQVALKKLRRMAPPASGGVLQAAMREIKVLQELRHPHIVRLRETFQHKDTLVLVFDYAAGGDLELLLYGSSTGAAGAPGGTGDRGAAHMKALLEALSYCHEQGVLHRDVKPNNLLLGDQGQLILADFGLARYLPLEAAGEEDGDDDDDDDDGWYRPPELLYGCRTYGTCIDVWAAGCVFAEMMLRRVWFKGNSDVEQLRLIFEVLGTPSEATWPGVTSLPNYLKFTPMAPKDLATIFPDATPDALDLLRQLTCLCPRERPTARQALAHPYFTADPPPAPAGELP